MGKRAMEDHFHEQMSNKVGVEHQPHVTWSFALFFSVKVNMTIWPEKKERMDGMEVVELGALLIVYGAGIV